MVIANNDELEGGGNSPDVLVVTTFHFLLAKDFYHKSDVCLHSTINRQNTPTHSLKIHIFCDIFFGAVGVESFEKRKFDFLLNFLSSGREKNFERRMIRL